MPEKTGGFITVHHPWHSYGGTCGGWELTGDITHCNECAFLATNVFSIFISVSIQFVHAPTGSICVCSYLMLCSANSPPPHPFLIKTQKNFISTAFRPFHIIPPIHHLPPQQPRFSLGNSTENEICIRTVLVSQASPHQTGGFSGGKGGEKRDEAKPLAAASSRFLARRRASRGRSARTCPGVWLFALSYTCCGLSH